MPNTKGVVLTDRDRVLLSYVGIARYASAEQIHKLLFDGCSKKQTYRRLAKLCTPGGRPGEGAHLRRLEFRRREGTGVPVWALTTSGRGVVEPLVSWLRPPAATDIGARFLEHTLLLNDVLLGLVLALRPGETAPLAALPFRWLSEDDGALEFQSFLMRTHERARAVLKPDAILEVPGRRRRLFIEAETGTQSIATANPGQTGAVVSKLRRYGQFFSGFAGLDRRDTWYTRAFPDGFASRLLFLVHSADRKRRVEKAVQEALGRSETAFKVLVLTFAEAAATLAPYITDGQLRGPATRGATRVVTMDAQKASRLRDGYNQLAEALNAMREAVKRHNATPGAVQVPLAPLPLEAVKALRDFIQQEVSATPAATAGEGQRSGASHG